MQTSGSFRRQLQRSVLRLCGKAGDEAGSSFVELAVVVPILSSLILGAAEYGRLAYAEIEVNNAARAGVAYGAQSYTTAQDTEGMKAAALNDGSDVTGLKPASLAATATLSCTCSDGTSVTCATVATKCVSPAHAIDYVQVNTTATMDPAIHVPGLPTSYALTGQAIMRVSQ